MTTVMNRSSLSPQEAASKRFRLIDVRTPGEFESGHAAGAELAPLNEIERLAASWRREEPLLLMCKSGRRSSDAADRLHAMGFQPLVVEGGFDAWSAAGLPVESSGRAVWSLERQVRFAAGSLVVTGVVLGEAVSPWFRLLAGGVGAGLVFAAVTDTCGMAMMLSRMPWNRRQAAAPAAPTTAGGQ